MPWSGSSTPGVPCVVVDRDLGETPVDQVLVDNDQGGYLAGQHLIALGHRRIACVVGPSDLTPERRADRRLPARAGRMPGWRSPRRRSSAAMAGTMAACAAAQQLLERGRALATSPPIFAFNDQMAIGAIGALQRAGSPRAGRRLGDRLRRHPAGAAIYPAADDDCPADRRDGTIAGPALARSHRAARCSLSAGACCRRGWSSGRATGSPGRVGHGSGQDGR